MHPILKRASRQFAAATTLLLAANLVACSTDNPTATGTPTPTAVGMLGGSAQAATVGSALTVPLQVHVTDQYGDAIAGAPVTFAATGGVTLASSSATTDASGNAQITATLGTRAGLDSITATIAGDQVPVTFLETALAGAATTITIASGNTQTGTSGVALAAPLVVTLMDQAGNTIVGDSVTWTSSAGLVSAPTSYTVVGGTTQVTFTPALGANAVTATVSGTALSAVFTETGN
jgi:hypothetical protein